MSVYRSGGVACIGVELYYGIDSLVPPTSWVRVPEVYEFTEFPREWDQIDFTSHDAYLPAHNYNRTAKPGLGTQSVLTFKSIWLETPHSFLEGLYVTRESWPFRFVYTFALAGPKTYNMVAWVANYTLSGDLGDKFVYSIQLVCEGVPQPTFPPSSDEAATSRIVTIDDVIRLAANR